MTLDYSLLKFLNYSRRQADSKLLSIWWFAVLVIILVGIVGGTLMFYSSKIDMRSLEGEILSSRVIDCIAEGGYVSDDYLKNNFDVFKTCGLSEGIINRSGDYYLNISVYDSNLNLIVDNDYGNRAFVQECNIGAVMIEAKNYPKCTQKEIFALNLKGETLKIKVFVGSNSEYSSDE
jgi:hypothetical protein